VSTEEIWREFSRPLLEFLCRRLPDPSDAEDLLQEIFLRVHIRIHTLRDHSRLAPWLYRIARNVLIDRKRKERRERKGGASPGLPLPEELPADESARARAGSEPERQIASGLRGMVELLPEGYRQALTLYELEGVKQREIARRLGLSLSGAKSRVQRGRQMLKEALLECCHFEFDRRGHIIDYRERQSCCRRCGCSSGAADAPG
jgi:RNA polymerase sigma-70 factor (ECF subfamily)